jgi:hypothetical protein
MSQCTFIHLSVCMHEQSILGSISTSLCFTIRCKFTSDLISDKVLDTLCCEELCNRIGPDDLHA